MSFVGKAVKKVFNFGKKVVKKIGKAFQNKWVRGVFIAALAVFAVGMGSSGYKGFGNLMASSGASTTIGAFFSAVGSTLATGFGTIWGAMGNAFAGGGGGQQLGGTTMQSTTNAAGQIVMTPSAVTSTGGNLALASNAGRSALITSSTTKTATTGLGTRMMNSLFGNSTGSQFLRGAVIGGFSYWSKKQEYDDQKKRANNATVWGGPAFGGSEDLPDGFIKKPISGMSSGNQSTARAVATGSSDAPSINTRPLYNPAAQSGPPAPAALLGKSTRLADLPSIGALLNPVADEAGAYSV